MVKSYFVFDRDTVKNRFFNTDELIRIKQEIHTKHRVNPETVRDHLLRYLDLSGKETVLDLGCGNGFFLEEVARRLDRGGYAVGLDLAPGVLDAAKMRFASAGLSAQWVEGSADDLSMFDESSFDRVMANYMMHYVPNLSLALREIRRVLRPGGLAILATDSRDTMPEMYQAHFRAMTRNGFPQRLFKGTPKGRFCLENGELLLREVFEEVLCAEYHDQLRFEESEPFMDFYAIGYTFCGAGAVPADDLTAEMFERLYADVRGQVKERIVESGSFLLTKRSGCFVCK